MNNPTDSVDEVVYFVVLPNGTEVPKDVYDEFRREIEDALNWLPPGVPCRIDQLVTPRFWLPKGNALRRDLGRCLAHWVKNGELPLEFVGDRRSTNKRYRRRTLT